MTGGGPAAASQAYGEAWYWDERYRKEAGPFDWYQKYPALAPLLRLYLAPHQRLLLVGCGNSVFGENMIDDGYQDVVNIDISSVVIEQMKKKYHDKPQLKYMKMDVKNMSDFESGSFDAVIDKGTIIIAVLDSIMDATANICKLMPNMSLVSNPFLLFAGTLDSLMCGQNSQENATKMLEEVNRILKENGVYMLITYGDPSYRLRLLKDMEKWTVKLHVIERWEKSSNQNKWELTKPLPLEDHSTSLAALLGPKPDVHYIYVCVKGNGGASVDSKAGEAAN
ncbi:S-adenosyl-L-methionine-dependent methyltransferase superfamily protein [Zea mays]|uniref:S-adenosyl-L-methionine-dependent methyltransferase superfamily protein n=1 Tax=Zea mays TaxID=4577 RepID=A0A1D6KJI3_MAIZE|nr:S-adenosyl-L-methionine-dependent methyltransferase superfamily protein [Zea mays]